MTMNRRQFLKNMGIGAAGAALPGVSMFAANEAMNPQDKSLFKLPELHCDVIVVGAGPAGIPAAGGDRGILPRPGFYYGAAGRGVFPGGGG